MKTSFLLGVVACAAALPVPALQAQNCSVEKELPFASTRVEEALQGLHAYAGERLPTLEGFAEVGDASGAGYKLGYFQYSLEVVPAGPAESRVRACAKITAWLDAAGSGGGYHQLVSNGRLESDLFERLDEALKSAALPASAPAAVPPPAVSSAAGLREISPPVDGHAVPAARPSSTSTAPLVLPKESMLPSAAVSTMKDVHGAGSTAAMSPAIQKLNQQAQTLAEVLNNQTRPDNLVAVKRAHTPVVDHPAEGAKVLFYADAEDEFQRLSDSGVWTHVQISGISRGWIRTALLEGQDAGAAKTAVLPGPPNKVERESEEVALFPGKWAPLDGKQVKIISVRSSSTGAKNAVSAAFREGYNELSAGDSKLWGVVVVVDAADGFMAAATRASLAEWEAGRLSNAAFWQRCYVDPQNALNVKD